MLSVATQSSSELESRGISAIYICHEGSSSGFPPLDTFGDLVNHAWEHLGLKWVLPLATWIAKHTRKGPCTWPSWFISGGWLGKRLGISIHTIATKTRTRPRQAASPFIEATHRRDHPWQKPACKWLAQRLSVVRLQEKVKNLLLSLRVLVHRCKWNSHPFWSLLISHQSLPLHYEADLAWARPSVRRGLNFSKSIR